MFFSEHSVEFHFKDESSACFLNGNYRLKLFDLFKMYKDLMCGIGFDLTVMHPHSTIIQSCDAIRG